MTSSGESPTGHLVMNRYARIAERFWQENRPQELAMMADPREFFSSLGQQVASQVRELTPQLVTSTPTMGYLERVGQENAARSQAEELVLEDLVYGLGPEEPAQEETDEASRALNDIHQEIAQASSEQDETT